MEATDGREGKGRILERERREGEGMGYWRKNGKGRRGKSKKKGHQWKRVERDGR